LSGELTGKLVIVPETPGEDLWRLRDEKTFEEK